MTTTSYYPTYCQELGKDLNGLSTAEVLELCDNYIDAQSRRHVCVWDLFSMGSDSKPLSRCARCKGVYYSSPQAQKQNWSLHKSSCKLPDLTLISGYNLQTAWSKLRSQISTGIVDETFSFLLRRIRNEFETANKEMSKTCEQEMQTVCRNLIFLEDSPRVQQFNEMMWSSPGTADLFLFGEDLILRCIRRHRIVYPLGLPSADGYNFVLQGSNMQNLASDFLMEESRNMALSGGTAVYKYCHLHFNLLLSCAVVGNLSRRAANDGIGTLRSGVCAEAAMKRVLELWLDERTRMSCGDAISAAFSFAVTYVGARKSRAGPGELAPNCPIDEVLRACLMEILENGAGSKHAIKVMKMLSEYSQEAVTNPWEALNIRQRAAIAILLAESISCSEGVLLGEYKGEDAVTVWDLGLDKTLEMICGSDPQTRLEIWRTAARGRDLCAIGRLDTGRAFFQCLLARWDMPKLLMSSAATEEDRQSYEMDRDAFFAVSLLATSMTEQALEFASCPWPCGAQYVGGRALQSAQEKLECYQMVMEPERFVSFNKTFNSPDAIRSASSGASKKKVTEPSIFELSAEELQAKSEKADQIAMSLWMEEEEAENDKKIAKKGAKKGKK